MLSQFISISKAMIIFPEISWTESLLMPFNVKLDSLQWNLIFTNHLSDTLVVKQRQRTYSSKITRYHINEINLNHSGDLLLSMSVRRRGLSVRRRELSVPRRGLSVPRLWLSDNKIVRNRYKSIFFTPGYLTLKKKISCRVVLSKETPK